MYDHRPICQIAGMMQDATTEADGTIVPVTLTPQQLATLDDWIARHDAPAPSRAAAIAQLLAGALGSHGPSTTIPNLVTGRDIV